MTQRVRGYLSRIAQPVRAGEGVLKPHPAPHARPDSAKGLMPVIEDSVERAEPQVAPNLAAPAGSPVMRPTRNGAPRVASVPAQAENDTGRREVAQHAEVDHGKGGPGLVRDARLLTSERGQAMHSAASKELAEVRSAASVRTANAAQPVLVSASAPSVPTAKKLETAASIPRAFSEEKLRAASRKQPVPISAEDLQEPTPVRRSGEETPRATTTATTGEEAPVLKTKAAANTETIIAEPVTKAPPREPGTPEIAETEKQAESAGPRVSIGTLEIRAVLAQKPAQQQLPVAPAAPPVVQRAPARAAEATPLARGLGWSYGLVQE